MNKPEARGRAAERTRPGGLGSRLRAWREQHLHALVSSLGRLAARPVASGLTIGVMAIAIALPLGLALAMGNLERFSGSVAESREIGVFLDPAVDGDRAGPWPASSRPATTSPACACARPTRAWRSSAP